MALIRPGSRTANGIIRRQEMAAGADPIRRDCWYQRRVTFRNFTTASTTQTIDLNVLFSSTPFPAGVFLLPGSYIQLVEVVAGGVISAATAILGDAGVTNGLVTSSNVFTGATLGPVVTPSATEYRLINYESQFVPVLTITTTTGNGNIATSGVIDIYIPYSVRPTARGV